MLTEPSNSTSTRREFLQGVLPAGALLCSGCGLLTSSCRNQAPAQDKAGRHKFLEDSGLTIIDAVRFAYQWTYIPMMQQLAVQIGRDKLVEMVKEATGIFWSHRTRNYAQRIQKKDLDAFLSWDMDLPVEDADCRKRFWSRTLTTQRIEATPKSYEMKVTECLWAQAFREADAADLGFAAICHADEAIAASFDPRLKLTRTKTLMNGDDCCHFRWVWEG
ncbi:MAG: L-2-amino-thiazoline-4-carboxylic acid hydrolase [candidate division KSB1 bacterium]|nr:L-2-amino-thiazoline-4-carboxylic acid hydrolase [candidate division KSB1 bacterium]